MEDFDAVLLLQQQRPNYIGLDLSGINQDSSWTETIYLHGDFTREQLMAILALNAES